VSTGVRSSEILLAEDNVANKIHARAMGAIQ
jgi:hypothetical protein